MYMVFTLCVLWLVYALYSWHRRNVCGHKLPPILPGALPIIGHNHLIYRYRNDFAAFMKYMNDFSDKSGGAMSIYFGDQIYYFITDIEDAATVANACSQKLYLFKLGEPLLGKGLFTASVTILGAHDKKDNVFINTYTQAINGAVEIIRARVLAVALHNDFLYKFSSLKKKEDELITIINKLIQETIQKRKDEMHTKANVDHLTKSDTEFRSFIDIMLEIAADGSLSDQEIKDELNTFAVGSYETTSRQLVYIMVLLGTYPDIQEKVFNEVMEVVGDRDLDKDNISSFIKECLRVVPVVSVLAKSVDRDLKLKNYTLRAGTSVVLLSDGVHRQPAWGPDAKDFRPERWLNKEKQPDNLFFAFGYGQRVCLGKKYAMVSMRVTLAHIVRMFRVKADFNKMKLKFDIIMEPESGHEITLERRDMK